MSIWNKQDWIKDILSKSGTEITEIKDEESKDVRKMVYYTALPLMMQSEQNATQICATNIKHEEGTVQISSAISNLSNNYLENQLYSDLNGSNRQPTHHQSVQMQIQQAVPQQPHHSATVANATTVVAAIKPQFKCDQCNMLFGSKSAHTSHIKSHAKMVQQQSSSNVGPAPSVSPGGSSSSSSSMATTTNLSSSDPYQCDVCKKTFAVPARLVRHYRTHTGERPFECEFCHKMFSVKENLQVHRRIHTKERPYKCEVCGRAFEHSGKLHRHMRIHTGERPHKCSVCGKTFIQSGQLVIHMRTHTGEKPYKCPVEGCGKGFTCSKQLKVHSRTHTGEKPYHCDICFRDFGYNHVLKLHRVQHYGSKCYKCTICDETFKSKKEMEAHIKGHANEIPDDEEDGTDSNVSSYTGGDAEQPATPSSMTIKIDIDDSPATGSTAQMPKSGSLLPETPRESSSEATSDGDEQHAYYNIYPRYDRAMVGNYASHSSGVNLLADVSMIASASELEDLRLRGSIPMQSSSPPPPPPPPAPVTPLPPAAHEHHLQSSTAIPQQHHPHLLQQQHQLQQQDSTQHPAEAMNQSGYGYEPLAVMRQQGYFAPVPKVEEFRSSIGAASEIVKRVEAAIAGVEPMLTPPRSSPESPERSSSPESDSTLMANRANLSLPLRKRKLYLKDEPPTDDSPTMRMSSVIQFAKAS